MTTHELNDTEKRTLLDIVLNRARADLNDGRPLTEMRQSRPAMTEEQKELFVDASTLAYMAIRFSGLSKQLSGKEWDEMADVMGEKVAGYLNELVDAELARRESERNRQ